MTSLPLLRAEVAKLGRLIANEERADRRDLATIAELKAHKAKVTHDLEVAESAVKVELTGLLDAIGSARWDAEQADQWRKAEAFREVEALVKGALS